MTSFEKRVKMEFKETKIDYWAGIEEKLPRTVVKEEKSTSPLFFKVMAPFALTAAAASFAFFSFMTNFNTSIPQKTSTQTVKLSNIVTVNTEKTSVAADNEIKRSNEETKKILSVLLED